MSHVLVVEDDPDLLFLYREALTRPGRKVTITPDGIVALAMLDDTEFVPDLIFLDINMASGASGFRVLDRIKETPRLENVQIVIVTANEQHRTYALSKGARFFKVKPFNVDEITRLADQLSPAA